jgi:hypothetical protein
MDRSRKKSLRPTKNVIPETAKTLMETRMTTVGVMLSFDGGGETAARDTIIAPALLGEGDMVDAVRVEGVSTGNYAPFWPWPRMHALNAFKLILYSH